MLWMRAPALLLLAIALMLRPKVISTWLHTPAAIAAAAACRAMVGLAPPCGTRAEKRRSGMPKLSMKSSAVPPTMPIGMTPSISFGVNPASAIALSDDSICSSNADLVAPRVYAVSPMPATQVLSRSHMGLSLHQRAAKARVRQLCDRHAPLL